MKSYYDITAQYYSKWLGTDVVKHNRDCFVYSEQRNLVQSGYNIPFDVYVFFQNDKMILSYGNKAITEINRIKRKITAKCSPDIVKETLEEIFHKPVSHNIKFYFHTMPKKQTQAKALRDKDYEYYLQFFKKNNSNCNNTDWVKAYFMKLLEHKACYGIFADDMLVCCSDSPDVPYLNDKVQEIGVHTLLNYRKKGYATDVCLTHVRQIIDNAKCPLWSCSWDNIASQKLAQKIGFLKFADVLTVTL